MIYRSKKYLEWIRKQRSVAPPKHMFNYDAFDDMVPAHQRIAGGNGGTGIKPHDTFAIPLKATQHANEHSGDFWGDVDRHKLIVQHICKYLDEKHNINGWKECAVFLTEMMDREGIK